MTYTQDTGWMRPALISFTLLALAILGSGCVRDTTDLDNYITEVKARRSAPIEPIPEIQPFETFSYPTEPMRDPFAPLDFSPRTETARSSGPRPDEARPREALEDYPLDTLRLMGTLQQKNNLWALVRAPSGTIHRVQTGNHLGKNHGRITHISEREIRLRELIPDNAGGWIVRDAALAAKE